MTDIFPRLMEHVLGKEGGYVNHPSDRGGETNWGVTVGVARRHGYAGAMRDMTRDQAVALYRKLYWNAPSFDQVAEIHEGVAAELFDTGINMGTNVAAMFLQRLLTGLNRQGRDYADIKPDGDIGPATLAALRSYLAVRGHTDGGAVLLKGMNALQGARYVQIAESRLANEDFLYGWLRTRL